MYWLANAAVVSATILTIVTAVLVHYEGLIYTAKAVVIRQHRSVVLQMPPSRGHRRLWLIF
jgi:hypothetical protein